MFDILLLSAPILVAWFFVFSLICPLLGIPDGAPRWKGGL